MPFDGIRKAVAANGGEMMVHGVVNSLECYFDGACLVIDWLIADLDGEFDFLLG